MTPRLVRWGLAVVVAVGVLGVLAPQVIRSPAQVAADRAAPDLPPATAVVEHRVLATTVLLRGLVTRAQRTAVEAVAAPEGRAVITAVRVREGATVRAGRVLVEVSGRPVILLAGRLPAYRDLRTGSTGPDVVQLQDALRTLGYRVDDPRGRLGPSTSAAVRRLYRERGYDPPAAARRTVRLPVSEVVYLAGLPARVDRLDARLGESVTESVMTLSSGPAVVTATLPAGDRRLVRTGQPAELSSELLGIRARGVVSSIGRLDGGDGPPGHPVRIRPRDPLPTRLFEREVRIAISAARTEGKVLVVPLSAVTARADGTSVVEVVDASARGEVRRAVVVTLGLVADGSVAVSPVGSALAAGDRVVVGAAPQEPS